MCAGEDFRAKAGGFLPSREAIFNASRGPFLRWFAQQIYEECFKQPNELCLIITQLTFPTPPFSTIFHPRGAPPFHPRSPTPRTLRLLPRLGLFGPPDRFRFFPSAPLLTPTFSTTFKKTNRDCIFNISRRLFLGIDNELVRLFLLSGKGKIGGCGGGGRRGNGMVAHFVWWVFVLIVRNVPHVACNV